MGYTFNNHARREEVHTPTQVVVLVALFASSPTTHVTWWSSFLYDDAADVIIYRV